ncbi:MAG TPA: DUF484 family protein [Steroidobacteraceae bacterium]|jgi:uncharacterized protein YigA (DUF484 family)|nr:DUF484 family protein [Steroidobacteraceae bacterium]
MSKPIAREADSPVSEDVLADYLVRHPDFFERHSALLTRLRIPHERGSQTISLVERQVQALRDMNQRLETKLREFVAVAQENDVLSGKIHRLSCRLIRSHGASQFLAALEASFREDFAVTHWVMLCLRSDIPELRHLTTRHLRLVEPGAPELKPFETFFSAPKPRVGQIRDTQRDYLFGNDAAEVGSAALVGLGPDAGYGLLAIGSNDVQRFQSTMSTDFLIRIGQLVSEAVAAL